MSKLRFVLLGCGGMMGGHARRLAGHPEAEIVGLCDVNEEIVRGFAERNLAGTSEKPAFYTDIDVMYAEQEPDAVVISTPHTQHYAQGVQALEAGCHVYMEKPMVTALADAYALDAKVKAAGKILVIGYNTPCSAEFYYLRELITRRRRWSGAALSTRRSS